MKFVQYFMIYRFPSSAPSHFTVPEYFPTAWPQNSRLSILYNIIFLIILWIWWMMHFSILRLQCSSTIAGLWIYTIFYFIIVHNAVCRIPQQVIITASTVVSVKSMSKWGITLNYAWNSWKVSVSHCRLAAILDSGPIVQDGCQDEVFTSRLNKL